AYASWLESMPALAIAAGDGAVAGASAKDVAAAPKRTSPQGKGPGDARSTATASASIVDPENDVEPAPPPPEPPRDAASFTALVEALHRGPVADISLPARNLALAGPALWPAIEAALIAPRKARKVDYIALLDKIGGDVPNRYGHF